MTPPENETLTRAILDTSLDGFILMNHEGVMLEWNRACELIFGYTRAEALGRRLDETIVPKPMREAHRQGLERYLATGEAVILGKRYELTALRRDGSEFPAEISVARVPGSEPPQFSGFVRDISDRARAQEDLESALEQVEIAARAMAESNERFHRLSDVASLQVWTALPNGELDWANEECANYFGAEVEAEVLGHRWAQFVHPQDLPAAQSRWAQSLATGERYEAEFRLRRGDGIYRSFLVRAHATREEGGKITHWIGTNTDVHDLKTAQGEAEHANQAKDAFLAILSHELRTPLTPVLTTLALWEGNSDIPAALWPDIQTLRRNVELEARLIDDLLDLTRIVKGKMPLYQEIVDVHSLVGGVVSVYRGEAESKGIRVGMALEAGTHWVNADPSRLQQVFWNIFRNAVKFTPGNGRIEIASCDDGPDRVCIRFTDNGIGMSADTVARIFRPFEQGDAETIRRYGGLGLGMSISKAIIEAHGGTIQATSEGPGKGSCFEISLPTVPEPKQAETEPSGLPPVNTEKERRLKILLVEDHPDTARTLTRLLEREGHEVEAFDRVKAALEALQTTQFDFLLSDIGLPDGTGIDVIKATRKISDMPAIALTGYGMEEDVAKCLAAGFSGHLTKPISFQKLQLMIRQLKG